MCGALWSTRHRFLYDPVPPTGQLKDILRPAHRVPADRITANSRSTHLPLSTTRHANCFHQTELAVCDHGYCYWAWKSLRSWTRKLRITTKINEILCFFTNGNYLAQISVNDTHRPFVQPMAVGNSAAPAAMETGDRNPRSLPDAQALNDVPRCRKGLTITHRTVLPCCKACTRIIFVSGSYGVAAGHA